MISSFEEKINRAIKVEIGKLKPSHFLLSKILDNIPVTAPSKERYKGYKGLFNQLINSMNTKLKVLVPALLAIVILVGGIYALRAKNSQNTPNSSVIDQGSNSQQVAATSKQNSSSATAVQPTNAQIQAASSDPDVIYNEMMSEADSEQASSQQGDADVNSAVSANNQDVQQLNNAYDENQF